MRILVVEDDEGIRNYLKTALESECFAVDVENDGQKGAFTACTNDYDVVILDLNLPGKDGLTICREIRADGRTVPIIMLSVRTEVPTKVQLINAGADDYLAKPFSFDELKARIGALLRRPREMQGPLINIGDLTIKVDTNEVVFRDKKVSLTKKEYMLLEFLAKNAGKILSRGAIMEHVWDMNADPFSNTIETHIRNIRKKLGQSDSDHPIKTVSGRGYMFDGDSR